MGILNKNIIEQIKNVLIVVLIFTTILLLYFLWGNESIEYFIFNDEDNISEINCTEVILPTEVVFGLGNEDYVVVSKGREKVWEEYILKTFTKFSSNASVLVEEISENKYKQVMEYPSIIAGFEYSMPFQEFCEMYEINQPQGYDGISNITQIAFSKGSSESAFIHDEPKDKYYRLVGNAKLSLFEEIEASLANVDISTYYTLQTFLGEESKNQTLIPVDMPQGLVTIPYQLDLGSQEDMVIGDMAKDYFGETFDFVRKIEEANGTTIYMYGYGQKVLIINPNDGSIEYKEDIKIPEMSQVSVFEALQSALNFISSHGGFETIQGQNIKPYLESVSFIDDKKGGYRFVFALGIDGNKVFYGNQMPIIVEVVDGQVSYFRRELINIIDSDLNTANDVDLTAINMLAMNYTYMASALAEEGVIEKTQVATLLFEDIADKIDHLTTGYYKSDLVIGDDGIVKSQNGQLIPVWIVEADGILFFFDLYTGSPVGYSVKY